jgi:hypothetical protein
MTITSAASKEKCKKLGEIKVLIIQKRNGASIASSNTSPQALKIKKAASIAYEKEFDQILSTLTFDEIVDFYDHTTKFSSSLHTSAVEILFEKVKDRKKIKENFSFYEERTLYNGKLVLIKTYIEYHKYILQTSLRMQNIYKTNIIRLCNIYGINPKIWI